MKSFTYYPVIFILSLAQTTFLPLNLILALLLFAFFRKGFYFALPLFIFGATSLALLASTSWGVTLLSLSLILGLVGLIKNYLPAAFFIRASLLILALPAYELVYSFLLHFTNRL